MTSDFALLVWDRIGIPPAFQGEVISWRSYGDGRAEASVPSYLESHAERIRARYLTFIHELGETVVAGRPLVEHLDLGEDFSFWWMTTLAEKSPLKSPRIYDCLRMFALEDMLLIRRPAALRLVSSDAGLAGAMRETCRHMGVRFEWHRALDEAKKWSVRRVYTGLPSVLKGMLSLRHALRRWRLRHVRQPAWFSGTAAVFIASYFIHLDAEQCARGEFHSRQWEMLPRLLQQRGRHVNWMQLFLFSSVVPNIRTGLDWTQRFNSDAQHQGCHAFLDGYLSFRSILKAISSWLKLCAVGRRLGDISHAFRPSGSSLWLWPLLRDDWRGSLSGPTGMANCLAVAQFDAALASLPRQQIGLYLWENQAWEKALLRAWRRHGHGQIIGVQHSTVPFWHLYNFEDPRNFAPRSRCPLPMPDCLAVNGTAAWEAFLATGCPEKRLVQVEALRYLNLSTLATVRGRRERKRDSATQVLVLGDMIASSMHHLLGLLRTALKLREGEYHLTFKPHPGYSVDLGAYADLQARETKQPLGRILADFDVAVAANSTSAAVDAYVAGLPVIIGLDGDELNLSPLRGHTGVQFVSTQEQLAAALQTVSVANEAGAADRDEFFFLDPELPRWKRLLALA